MMNPARKILRKNFPDEFNAMTRGAAAVDALLKLKKGRRSKKAHSVSPSSPKRRGVPPNALAKGRAR